MTLRNHSTLKLRYAIGIFSSNVLKLEVEVQTTKIIFHKEMAITDPYLEKSMDEVKWV